MGTLNFAAIAFSIVFLLIGVAGTYVRQTSAVDGPLAIEFLGWGAGSLMLGWAGLFAAAQTVLPSGTLFSVPGVFVLGVVVNATTLFVSIKLWGRYDPTWLIGRPSHRLAQNPLGAPVTGYVALCRTAASSDSVGIEMYARDDPDSIRQRRPDSVVTNVERARDIVATYHGWDLGTEGDLSTQRSYDIRSD